MKKNVLLALLVISMLPIYAQTSLGLIAGYNLASQHPKEKDAYGIWDYTFKQGWRAGLIADHHLWKKFHLQPQLMLNSKGMKARYYYDGPVSSFSSKYNTRTLYLDLQANLIFKEPLGNGKLLIGAGPYLGRGINGKNKANGYVDMADGRHYSSSEAPIKFRNKRGNDPAFAYQRPYDAGINFQAGYECKNGLFFNAVYSHGLTSTSYKNDNTLQPKNTYFGLSIGYFLKKIS